MRFKLKIFIPNNVLYKELEFEADSIYEAKNLGNQIFSSEFQNSGKKSGNFFLEQIV